MARSMPDQVRSEWWGVEGVVVCWSACGGGCGGGWDGGCRGRDGEKMTKTGSIGARARVPMGLRVRVERR